jgi:excisionase family DNA binding protein
MSTAIPESTSQHVNVQLRKPPSGWREDTTQSSAGVVKLLYSRKEAAYALGISIRALDYLLSRRSIKTRRIGARVLIHRDDLTTWASRDHLSSVAA